MHLVAMLQHFVSPTPAVIIFSLESSPQHAAATCPAVYSPCAAASPVAIQLAAAPPAAQDELLASRSIGL